MKEFDTHQCLPQTDGLLLDWEQEHRTYRDDYQIFSLERSSRDIVALEESVGAGEVVHSN